MPLLAEISDKIVSPADFWVVMGAMSVWIAWLAYASRSWGVLLLAAPVSALGWILTLSFLDDPMFGDAVLREQGWPWFANNLAASTLPVTVGVVIILWRKRQGRIRGGFEVLQSTHAPRA